MTTKKRVKKVLTNNNNNSASLWQVQIIKFGASIINFRISRVCQQGSQEKL